MTATQQQQHFARIRSKVESGERLNREDGMLLYDPAVSLQEIGELANLVRERLHGNVAYYNINTHLNPTNVCIYRCRFCAFRSDLRNPKGYAMTPEQVLARGAEAYENGCTEMHIVGGLHQKCPIAGIAALSKHCIKPIQPFILRLGRRSKSAGLSS